MPTERERLSSLETSAEHFKGRLDKHDGKFEKQNMRLRRLEQATAGILVAGSLIGWAVTQVINIMRLTNVAN